MISNATIQAMKERVFRANLQLPQWGLVKLTWGNVSEINRQLGIIVIKPSGVDYQQMEASQMVVTDLDGCPLEEGSLKPSSDLATHVILYRAFKDIQSVVHTHSTYAVAWAQAGRAIPVYGTTHADTFYGQVPVTRQLTAEEVKEAYEVNTGHVIVERFEQDGLDPLAVPGVIVNGHGPFTWGTSTAKAIENSLVLDEIAHMAMMTEEIQIQDQSLPQYVLDKHYYRKHGANAYYGQS
ncbi:L-ribulose-5-phosphate 4-epimerase AraD [Vaginisenegalia massiliensis]|uniref:L-ribulose-5-phosphate 4-epimerase AraD n=1 Tax=Vaginisenegalia massiliensis TaxID=2058294 RepID=UPI000F51E5B0|nr:L-ribulose-5-phosphate 4-epimerase AraD [Vaginisenegalia massiliensis]